MKPKRIIMPGEPRARPVRPRPVRAVRAAALAVRPATAADLPWVTAWTSRLGLPMPTSRRVRTYILLEDGQRVGHLAGREDQLTIEARRQSLMWLISGFIVPASRGRGLMMRFCEILSREVYDKGKVGARVAADNARMHKLMAVGGWTVRRRTRRYTDYLLDLGKPFRAKG